MALGLDHILRLLSLILLLKLAKKSILISTKFVRFNIKYLRYSTPSIFSKNSISDQKLHLLPNISQRNKKATL